MIAGERFAIGVDFGTLSGRAVVVRVDDGEELATAVREYTHGVLERTIDAEGVTTGERLPPDWALQAPRDYVEVLQVAVPEAVRRSGIDPAHVIGIGTAFTACTVLPVLADGTPLCELSEFRERPHAYVKLWKHHAAQPQADRINRVAAERNEPWLARYGGLISSEWQYAKALQLLEEDPEIYARMDHWVEAADWIIWQLCGEYVRNACTAGYKGIWQDGSHPSADFEAALNPAFEGFAATKLGQRIGRLGTRAGRLTEQAACWTGLPKGIPVAVGNVDAHATAPAARAVEHGQMLAIMGTSTCHVINHDRLVNVAGMCGVVDGGVVAGAYGYEAGQSGVGDIFAWYVANQVPGRYFEAAAAAGMSIHDHLTELAFAEAPGAHGLVALDWVNGNRSVLADAALSGLFLGHTLDTTAEQGYRALLEATAFGTRMIVEAFRSSGVPVRAFVVAGGLVKNRRLIRLYSDVLGMPISVIASEQGPALGSAIHAAVAAGAYPDVLAASERMGRVEDDVYVGDPVSSGTYDRLYEEYRLLHDHFGRGSNDVMKRLRQMRQEALA